MKISKHQMDMCNGPLLRQIFQFSIPMVFSTLLQFSFNVADLIVVGRFGSHQALAGVGASHYIVSFMLTLFSGTALGATVVVGRYFGAKNQKMVRRALHTAMAFGIISGIVSVISGVCLARPVLMLFDTPQEILPGATTYLRVYMAGMLFCILYNLGAGILRAAGDSMRPLVFVVVAGIVNVVLNLFFVVSLKWYEGGVALATVISKAVAAGMVLVVMIRSRDVCRLKIRNLRIDWKCLKDILWIGLPTGIQGGLFHFSNMVMQSAINGFGTCAVAGSIAVANVGTMLHSFAWPFCQAAVSFISQNIGGKRYDRMYKSVAYSAGIAIPVALVAGMLAFLFRYHIIALYNPNPEVVAYGALRASISFTTFFLLIFMEFSGSCLRGIGYSLSATISSLIGSCGLRLVWVWVFFPLFPNSFLWLITAYPLSWFLTGTANTTVFWVLCKKHFPKSGEKKK